MWVRIVRNSFLLLHNHNLARAFYIRDFNVWNVLTLCIVGKLVLVRFGVKLKFCPQVPRSVILC
jgi:hypothetical protein